MRHPSHDPKRAFPEPLLGGLTVSRPRSSVAVAALFLALAHPLAAQDAESKMPKDMVRADGMKIPSRTQALPRATPKRDTPPDPEFWTQRDLAREIAESAKAGSLPLIPVHESVTVIEDFVRLASGWQAYGFIVAPRARLQFTLQGPRPGWCRLLEVDMEGRVRHQEVAAEPSKAATLTITNAEDHARVAYVVVDDPGKLTGAETPFHLAISHNWETGKADLRGARFSVGVWAAQPGIRNNVLRQPPPAPSPQAP